MMDFTHDRERKDTPQTWRYLQITKLGPDKRGVFDRMSATITCPKGHSGVLEDHNIKPDGMVEPSVVCPIEGCGFHDYIRLLGWQIA